MSKEQLKELAALVEPLSKWIAEEQNPHAKVIVDCNGAELVYGEAALHFEREVE